jgi:transcriptional regulator with PAS, ATPase and Fis domain
MPNTFFFENSPLIVPLLSAISDPVVGIDLESVVRLCNEALCAVLGREQGDILGRPVDDVLAGSRLMQEVRGGQPEKWRKFAVNGRSFLVNRSPLAVDGRMVGALATLHEISELEQMSAELNRLRDELGAVGNLKNRCEAELKEVKQRTLYQGEIIVRSAPMRRVLDLSSRLSAVDSTVLIHGESGVGKEVIAEYIHHNSQRKDKAFIKINCTAIPETLLESELFGYVRGAFTGASREGRPGLFEAAHGGTLLLDEVGDLPMSLQVKLLRVIQERQTRRVGDNTPRFVDVRLIAATNHDLVSLVERKLFREDLYYRLNVVPLHVPPLRERKEDIIFMVQSFLRNFCKRHKREKNLHPAVIPCLLDHHWPGNVRELANMMERLVVTSPGPVITLQDLPSFLRGQNPLPASQPSFEGRTLKGILDNVEASVLREALARYKSTRKAAEALGIDQSSVVRKAKRLGLTLSRSLVDPANGSG